jgi:hypothetical protein
MDKDAEQNLADIHEAYMRAQAMELLRAHHRGYHVGLADRAILVRWFFTVIGCLVAAALIILCVGRANADEANSDANKLAVIQAADVWSTRAIIHLGGYERDPLAAPFVHNTLELTAVAVVMNVAFRHVRSPFLRHVIMAGEALCVGNNILVIHGLR